MVLFLSDVILESRYIYSITNSNSNLNLVSRYYCNYCSSRLQRKYNFFFRYVEHPAGKTVETDYLQNGSYFIEVRNKKYPATLFLKSPFDPNNLRLKGHYEHDFQEQEHFED